MVCLACCRDGIEVPVFLCLMQLLDQGHYLMHTSHLQAPGGMSTSLGMVRMPGPFPGCRHHSTLSPCEGWAGKAFCFQSWGSFGVCAGCRSPALGTGAFGIQRRGNALRVGHLLVWIT